MIRYFALSLATLSCACGSLPATVPSGTSKPAMTASPQPHEANLPDAAGARSTVPMTGDTGQANTLKLTGEEQKDSTLKAVSRAIHLYWFFGAR